MALATRCPHCQTTFRVVHDQLKLRSGMVRCGNCQQIFNGIEHLIRANTPTAASGTGPHTTSAISATSAPPAPTTQAASPASPQIALAKAPLPQLPPEPPAIEHWAPPTAPPEPAAAPEPPAAPEPTAAPEPAAAPIAPEPATTPASAGGRQHNLADQLAGETLSVSRIEPQLDDGPWEHKPTPQELATAMAHHQEPKFDDEDDQANSAPAPADNSSSELEEPSFVRAGRRQQKWRRVWSLLQATACVLFMTLLLGQSIYTWRDIIVLRWPASKIMIFNACTILGCKVGLPTQIHAISIELGELQVLPRNKNTFSYSTALRNHSNLVQAWPHIELILTDGNDIAVARRVFTPADYLSNDTVASKGFAPQSDHPVKLYFEFLQLKAANYRAEIFYP